MYRVKQCCRVPRCHVADFGRDCWTSLVSSFCKRFGRTTLFQQATIRLFVSLLRLVGTSSVFYVSPAASLDPRCCCGVRRWECLSFQLKICWVSRTIDHCFHFDCVLFLVSSAIANGVQGVVLWHLRIFVRNVHVKYCRWTFSAVCRSDRPSYGLKTWTVWCCMLCLGQGHTTFKHRWNVFRR